MTTSPELLARELSRAYAERRTIPIPPSGREGGLDLPAAYAVEAELTRLRRADGARTVGRKIGFANRALWRVFKLDSVLWAHMYDDTVRYAAGNTASLGVGRMVAPRIEPEIVFRLNHPPGGDPADPAAVLAAVEWLALGFEIVDCVYQDWKFKPQDFVAAFGLHAALVVGERRMMEAEMIPELVERLPAAGVRLLRDGGLVAQGTGANVLGSPVLSLGELGAGIARQANPEPLARGELIATGALTDNQGIAAGESWTASIDGLGLADLTLRITA